MVFRGQLEISWNKGSQRIATVFSLPLRGPVSWSVTHRASYVTLPQNYRVSSLVERRQNSVYLSSDLPNNTHAHYALQYSKSSGDLVEHFWGRSQDMVLLAKQSLRNAPGSVCKRKDIMQHNASAMSSAD